MWGSRAGLLAASALGLMLVAGCGGGDGSSAGAGAAAEGTRSAAVDEGARSAAVDEALVGQFRPPSSKVIAGTASAKFSTPAGDGPTIVAQGEKLNIGGSLPVVIRNDGDQPVWRVTVAGQARNPAGKLIGSGADQTLKPNFLEPGQIAIGYVFFGGDTLPASTKYELSVGAESGPYENIRDMEISETSASGDTIHAVAKNRWDVPLTLPSAYAACLDGKRLLDVIQAFGTTDPVPPGGQTTFSLESFDRPCPNFLIASTGFAD